jgi:hypothetical protein
MKRIELALDLELDFVFFQMMIVHNLQDYCPSQYV